MRILGLASIAVLCCSCGAPTVDVDVSSAQAIDELHIQIDRYQAEIAKLQAANAALKSKPAPDAPREVHLRMPPYPPELVGVYRPAAGNLYPWDEVCFDPATLQQWWQPLQRGMGDSGRRMRGAD